jgi:hypothetical protein
MFTILRGANGRRREVDFRDDPVTVDVAMSASTVQITMTTAGSSDLSRARYLTVTLPRDALASRDGGSGGSSRTEYRARAAPRGRPAATGLKG